MLKNLACLSPSRATQTKKRIERIVGKDLSVLKLRRAEMTDLFENGKIDGQITNSDTHARLTLLRLKDPEGKILNGKMRIGCDFNE